MKKIKMMIAVLAITTFSACAAEVFSANIVGYTKVNVYPGPNMFGAAFGEVTKGGANQNFQKIFIDDTEFAKGGGSYATSDTIQIWDPTAGIAGGYTTYYYYVGISPSDPDNNLWFTLLDVLVTTPMSVSQGFWYNSKNSGPVEMTVAGEVNLAATATKTIHKGNNSVSFAYPTDFDLNNDVDWANSGAKGGGSYATSDTIQIWDPTAGIAGGYTTYYYYVGTNPSDPDNNLWFTLLDALVTTPIPAAQGFWYNHKGNGFTLEFIRPFDVVDVE